MRNHFAQLFLMGKRSEVVCFFHRATRGFMVFIRKEPIDWKAYLGTLSVLWEQHSIVWIFLSSVVILVVRFHFPSQFICIWNFLYIVWTLCGILFNTADMEN